MSKHLKTKKLLEVSIEVLKDYHPMTVRQIYYQLVSRQVIKNNRSQYQSVSNLLVDARQDGSIPWEWIEDRLRVPRSVSMWDDLSDFIDTVLVAYKRDIWDTQPNYLEVWLEKDALSGIFEDILRPYGVTLQVCRGFDSWSSIHDASERLATGDTILYFGDFDPSGEDMVRDIGERLSFFGCYPEIIKCALNPQDITTYNLPPAPTKPGDTRSAAFVAEFGDECVELDALPVNILRTRLKTELDNRLDLIALGEVNKLEQEEKSQLEDALENI